MSKPIVRFTLVHGIVVHGMPALLTPVDHPSSTVSNNGPVQTSPVIGVCGDEAGIISEIETLNTVYLRADHD